MRAIAAVFVACLLAFAAPSAAAAAGPAAAAKPAGAEAVTVTLRPEATVDAERVALADVAEVSGEQPALAGKIRGVDLGPAPAPGHEREVTRDFLELRLRQLKLDTDQVSWSGPSATRVSRRSTVLPGAVIGQAAADQVRKLLPWPDEDLVIEVQRPPADVTLLAPAEDLRYTVALARSQRLLGPVPVRVTVSDGNRALAQASTLLNVRVFQRVVVARRRIAAGERLSKDDVQFQRTELTVLGNEAIPNLAEALGQETRQVVPAFAVLTRRMLAPARIVRRGALVTLMAETEVLRVTARGIAQQDGAAGEVIGVQNVDSRKIVYGVVLTAQTVRVPF